MNKMKTEAGKIRELLEAGMAEKDWDDVLQRQIERAGGIMPFFIQKCICQKVWHSILIKYAMKFSNPRILEVGCGFAWDSIYLSYFLKDIEAIDIDAKVVSMAKSFNNYLHGNVEIYQKDIFKIEKGYDIIFNNGTYEHFKKEEIKEIIRIHLSKASYLIFCVPLNMSRDIETFGNELLMPENEWKNIIKEAGGKTIETYGLDFPRALAFATYISLFSKIFKDFGNFRIFVITKK